jgi:hypothetical protein
VTISVPARRAAAAVLAACLGATAAHAQTTGLDPLLPATPAGLVLTPSAGVAALWDDNVALTSDDIGTLEDFVTAVTPNVALIHRARRGTLSLQYRGTYELHRELTEFDTADHRGRLDFDRQVSRRVSLFARNEFARAPTTQITSPATGLVTLQRRTTRFNDFRGGAEITPTDRMTISAAYVSQWIKLARGPLVDPLLQGGRSDGADISALQRLTPRFAVGGRYDAQRAVVANGGEGFNVQRALALLEYALGPTLTLTGEAGRAWQTAGLNRDGQAGPAYQVGLQYQRQQLVLDVSYGRSFLPSFGFGGTVQNEEFRSSVRAPISRRIEVDMNASWRVNDQLNRSDLSLRSTTINAALAYLPVRWLRVEAFTLYSDQNSQIAGGQLSRAQTGVRVSTLHLMRLR